MHVNLPKWIQARCTSGEALTFWELGDNSVTFNGHSKGDKSIFKSAIWHWGPIPIQQCITAVINCLSYRNISLPAFCVSLSVCVSLFCSLLSVWNGLSLTRGIFLGKSYGNKKKKTQSLNSKSMFHLIFLPLCAHAFYELSSFLAHWRHCVFLSDHQKTRLSGIRASCTHWGEAGKSRVEGSREGKGEEKEEQAREVEVEVTFSALYHRIMSRGSWISCY